MESMPFINNTSIHTELKIKFKQSVKFHLLLCPNEAQMVQAMDLEESVAQPTQTAILIKHISHNLNVYIIFTYNYCICK